MYYMFFAKVIIGIFQQNSYNIPSHNRSGLSQGFTQRKIQTIDQMYWSELNCIQNHKKCNKLEKLKKIVLRHVFLSWNFFSLGWPIERSLNIKKSTCGWNFITRNFIYLDTISLKGLRLSPKGSFEGKIVVFNQICD